MPRLLRFALALALFTFSVLVSAQTPNAQTAPPKDTVLFDFDGNYEDWTLTGDCWNTHPATTKTFVDRQGNSLVTGIVGTGFLISQYKNPAATGKAVSRDFTIDKPFLNFKIGGGHFPNQACLNLLVDGKIVRTETGNDSTELRPAYWDVYVLMGKTTHLKVVDATPILNRGYIMIDDICLSEIPPVRPQSYLEQMKITPFFSNTRIFIRTAISKDEDVTLNLASRNSNLI